MPVPKSFRNSSEKFPSRRVSQAPASEPREFIFGPVRMDIGGQRLWHERRATSPRPKPGAGVGQAPASEPREFIFGPFRMDIGGQRLWHERRAISLRPKSWDVLRYLVERPGLLGTKADLHREVWQDAPVVEDTLTQSI